MMTDKTYDYIIYSAGIAGVINALDLTARGKSVLLLNFYGFMGGSITESLNCLQIADGQKLNSLTKIVFENIKKEKHGIFYQKENILLFNPEVVKTVLQKLVEDSKVDLLFHIVPLYLKQKDQFVEFSLTGKEGIFHVSGKTVIDASDEYDLLKLENAKRNLNGLYCNIFLTGLKDDSWQEYILLYKKLKLNDSRYWVSLKLSKSENEFFIENDSQKIINDFEEIVQKSGGRIQILAPQVQKVYSVDKIKTSKNIFHIDSLLNQKYERDEILAKTSELESKLNVIK